MVTKSQEEPPTGLQIYFSHPWNLIKTGFLLLTWITLGFHLELVSPTMSVLVANIAADYNAMGSALSARGAGYFVANILGAVLQKVVKKHSEGLLVCAFVLPAIAVFATPFVQSLIPMCVLFFIQGMAQGLTDLGGTNILLTMWGANAAAPMNTVHLGYGIGAVFVNLLVRPFIASRVSPIEKIGSEVFTSTLSSTDIITSTLIVPLRQPLGTKSSIFVPYTITAVLCLLIAVGHLFFYIREQKTSKEKLEVRQIEYSAVSTNADNAQRALDTEENSYSPRTCGRGFFQYGLILSIIFIIYTVLVGGNDQTFSKFFFTYLKSDEFHLSTSAANLGIILYWLSYSFGRLIGAIVSVYVSVTMCLNIVWFGGLCLAVAWMVVVWLVGLTGTNLFVLGAATGFVFAPIFPLSFGLYKQRLNVIPVLLALLLCGSAVGAIVFAKVAGFVMDHNPKHFPTLLITLLILSIVAYIVSQVVYFFHQKKNLANPKASATRGTAPPTEIANEEEIQMEKYLRDQE